MATEKHLKRIERISKYTEDELLTLKERIKKENKQHYDANKDRILGYKKKYREKNKERLNEIARIKRAANRHNNYQHLKEFNLTKEQYLEMLEKQNHGCAICGGKDINRKLAVDHCHTTGVIRGLLCSACNTSLGKFKDSVELLQKAIQYLKDNNGNKPNAIIVKKAPRRRVRSSNS